jgi:hypothetical protein
VSALDSTTLSNKARQAINTGVASTSVLLRNSTVIASGNASLVALDASSWNAEGGAYSVNFTGGGNLGASRAGNQVRSDVSAMVGNSNVTAADLRLFAKGAQTLKATIAPNKLDPVDSGQLDYWVDMAAQRAWNQVNGGVRMDMNASTLALSGGMVSGASARARLSANTPAGTLRSGILSNQEESMARNVVGSTAAELRALRDQVRAMLKEQGSPPSGRWADIAVLEPVRDYKARHASTLLTFDAVVEAIGKVEASRSAA